MCESAGNEGNSREGDCLEDAGANEKSEFGVKDKIKRTETIERKEEAACSGCGEEELLETMEFNEFRREDGKIVEIAV